MRFPSINAVLEDAQRTFVRFPFVLGCALVAAIAAILRLDVDAHGTVLLRLVLVASLGIPFHTALALAVERWQLDVRRRSIVALVALALLTALFLASRNWSEPVAVRRYVQLSLGAHLLVAFLPYARRNEPNGFWQYNRALFSRFLVSVLFSAVLFAGLAIALAALDKLFGLRIEVEVYFRLLMVIGFIFNTAYFLAGIPLDLAPLDSERQYPVGLKVLSQYILLPIVVVYLAILTIYLGKIVVTRNWPSGWIGYLVSSVAAAGIFSLLLVHPIRDRVENRWIQTYDRWFYLALMPAIAMLLLAVWKRVHQYGITENRYFLVVLALWLLAVALRFTASPARNIKVIPASLAAVAFVTFAAPWGAYSVSKRNQRHRFEALLQRHNMLQDGRALPASSELSFEVRREMSSVLTYLLHTHGSGAVDDWLGGKAEYAEVDTLQIERLGQGDAQAAAQLVLGHLGVGYVQAWEGPGERHFYFGVAPGPNTAHIAGYDYIVRNQNAETVNAAIAGREYEFALDNQRLVLTFRAAGDSQSVLEVDLQPLVDVLEEYRNAPRSQLAQPVELTAETGGVRVRVDVYGVAGEYTRDGVLLQSMTADYLVWLGEQTEDRGSKDTNRTESAPAGVLMLRARNGIPAIFEPQFVTAKEADIPEDAWVLGALVDNEAHAYSLNLLNEHEIVNDRIAGRAIAAVW